MTSPTRLRRATSPFRGGLAAAVFASVQILPLQIAHHLHVAGLAVCIASGQQVFVAWSQILLTDALIGRVTVRAGVDAGHDAGGNVIILADKRFAVRLRGKIAVTEGAESGKLRAVIRLAEFLTNGGRDEAQSEEFLRKPPEMDS